MPRRLLGRRGRGVCDADLRHTYDIRFLQMLPLLRAVVVCRHHEIFHRETYKVSPLIGPRWR